MSDIRRTFVEPVTSWLTFNGVKFGVQSEAYLRFAYVHKFIFVVFGASEFANYISQHIVLAWAYLLDVARHEMMY